MNNSIITLRHLAMSACLIAGLASCTDDSFINKGSEEEMTLSIQMPEGLRSRSKSYYGEGDGTFYLSYAIEGPDGRIKYSSESVDSPQALELRDGEWAITARLMQGEKYKILVWADQYASSPSSPYDVDLSTGNLTINYTNGGEEDLDDAFAAYKEFVAGQPTTITMKRPFVQVIIGSNEKFVKNNEVVSCVGMGGTDGAGATIYRRLNLKTGQAGQPSSFDNVTYWRSSDSFLSKDFYGNHGAKYITMRYLIPPPNGSEISFNLKSGDEERAYTVNIGSAIKANSRIVIVPECTELGDNAEGDPVPGKSGFFDEKGGKVTFNIINDTSFQPSSKHRKVYIVDGQEIDARLVLAGRVDDGLSPEDCKISINDREIQLVINPETKDFLYVLPEMLSGRVEFRAHNYCVKEIFNFPSLANVSDASYLMDCCYASSISFSEGTSTSTKNMSHMFQYCYYVRELDLSMFNTSQVTNMEGMFYGCTLDHLNLANFDISKVTDFNGMFSNATVSKLTCKAAFRDWVIANQTALGLVTLPEFILVP